jgi:Kef-type K+ transport system membrane component KefB
VSLLIIQLANTVYANAANPVDAATKAVVPVVVDRGTDPLRVLLFGLTFVAIGINTRISLLQQYKIWSLYTAFVVARLVILVLGYFLAVFFFLS